MKTLRFKTNINCGGCIAKVTPALNALTGPEKWAVDTNDPKKILSIETSHLTVAEVKNTLEKEGFKAEELQ